MALVLCGCLLAATIYALFSRPILTLGSQAGGAGYS
jgi:hypothetical protein